MACCSLCDSQSKVADWSGYLMWFSVAEYAIIFCRMEPSGVIESLPLQIYHHKLGFIWRPISHIEVSPFQSLWYYFGFHVEMAYKFYPIYRRIDSLIFTRGQFWPSGIVVACVCVSVCPCVRVSVCVCVNHGLVRALTHHSFKLESPNLEQRCKRPWLSSLLFWGMIDLDLQGQI